MKLLGHKLDAHLSAIAPSRGHELKLSEFKRKLDVAAIAPSRGHELKHIVVTPLSNFEQDCPLAGA